MKEQVILRLEPFARPPGNKARHGQLLNILSALLDHQVVDREVVTGGKAQLRESQVNAVLTQGVLTLQAGQIGLLAGWDRCR